MSKRPAIDDLLSNRTTKRGRYQRDPFSSLSDELLLRVFSNVSVYTLTVCQRVSKRLNAIAGDSQLWKAAYYNRFVRPRAARLPGVKGRGSSAGKLYYSSKLSIWLDEEKLVRAGQKTNWKTQYKLSNNWSRGSCGVREIPLACKRSVPPLLARLHDGVVYTADSASGLRAWSYRKDHKLLGSIKVELSGTSAGVPMSLALDSQSGMSGIQRIVIGFEDGSFSSYEFNTLTNTFQRLYRHPPSSNGPITALAFTWPYLLSLTDMQLLSVYKFSSSQINDGLNEISSSLVLLTSLKSHTAWPPLSLSLRLADQGPVVSIAFSLPTYTSGWSIGIQELRMKSDGAITGSRLTSAFRPGFHPLALQTPSVVDSDLEELDQRHSATQPSTIYSKPTSVSYSHPYLLVSHSDNTLTLYLVTSNSSSLSISAGKRLWGHTSSVSGAYIADRGKAVSFSARGNELRVWELEGSTLPSRTRPHSATNSISIQVTPETTSGNSTLPNDQSEAIAQWGTSLGLAMQNMVDDQITARGVGFDDESVIVLRENMRGCGSEALLVYDFT